MKKRDRARWKRWGILVLALGAGIGFLGWQIGGSMDAADGEETMDATQGGTQEAIFGGGCFWCIEAAFQVQPGVTGAVSGYTGGDVENPTYEEVSTGRTGHFEAVLVRFDPEQVTYEELLDIFWQSIDPTDAGGQFYDRGSQYHTAIFYLDEAQRVLAEASKQELEASGRFDEPIATQILPAQPFYVAEAYHQDYFEKYLAQYNAYNTGSGRKQFLEETWANNDDDSSDDSDEE